LHFHFFNFRFIVNTTTSGIHYKVHAPLLCAQVSLYAIAAFILISGLKQECIR
jgi:hypothetical protein